MGNGEWEFEKWEIEMGKSKMGEKNSQLDCKE